MTVALPKATRAMGTRSSARFRRFFTSKGFWMVIQQDSTSSSVSFSTRSSPMNPAFSMA